MKSPAIAEPMKAVYRLVKEAEAEHKKALREWSFTKATIEAKKAARRDALKKAAKAGKNLETFRGQIEEDDDHEEPTERRYIVNDTTVEKYGELLNKNPWGLLIFRDELTGWLRSLDDERRANDRAFFLEAWNGDGSYTYDRIGRGTLKIGSTTTSILGGIQPGPLESYLRNALGYGEGDDGLMQRFQMIVYPDISAEWRNVDRWPDTEAKNRAFTIYRYLSDLDPQTVGAETDDDGHPFVGFDGSAQELFTEWLTSLNHSLRSGKFEHPALEAHFAKYKSLMPSLALIFHLCEVANGVLANAVSLHAAEMAAAWCEFLMEHAKRIYGLGIGARILNARTLAGHLLARDVEDDFTARVVAQKGWAGLSSVEAVREAADTLVDYDWLRAVEIRSQVGRPSTHYLINQGIWRS
jgi:putative DNA primase/helicase